MKPVSTSIVHKPKQLVTESQITLSCEVEGSVPDTDVKWTQNNRLFERGTVSSSNFELEMMKKFWFYIISNFLFCCCCVCVLTIGGDFLLKFYCFHIKKFFNSFMHKHKGVF